MSGGEVIMWRDGLVKDLTLTDPALLGKAHRVIADRRSRQLSLAARRSRACPACPCRHRTEGRAGTVAATRGSRGPEPL